MRIKKPQTKEIGGTKAKKTEKNAEQQQQSQQPQTQRKKTNIKNATSTNDISSTNTTANSKNVNDENKKVSASKKATSAPKKGGTLKKQPNSDKSTAATAATTKSKPKTLAQKKPSTTKSDNKKQSINSTSNKNKVSSPTPSIDDKINKLVVRSSKELKNLDISFNEYDSLAQTDVETIANENIIKASISENVKTKSRSTSASATSSSPTTISPTTKTATTTIASAIKPVVGKTTTNSSANTNQSSIGDRNEKEIEKEGQTKTMATAVAATAASTVKSDDDKTVKPPPAKKKKVTKAKEKPVADTPKSENVKKTPASRAKPKNGPEETKAKEKKKPKVTKETKEVKEAKEVNEPKDSKDSKDAKDAKDSKDVKETKKTNEPKEVKKAKEPKTSKPVRKAKKPTERKISMDPEESAVAKESNDLKEMKEPSDSKEIKTEKESKIEMEFKSSIEPKDSKEQPPKPKVTKTAKAKKEPKAKPNKPPAKKAKADTSEKTTAPPDFPTANASENSSKDTQVITEPSTDPIKPTSLDSKPRKKTAPKKKAKETIVTNPVTNSSTSPSASDSITEAINEVIKQYTEMASDSETPEIGENKSTKESQSNAATKAKSNKSNSRPANGVKTKDGGKVKKTTAKSDVDKSIKKKVKDPVVGENVKKVLKETVKKKSAPKKATKTEKDDDKKDAPLEKMPIESKVAVQLEVATKTPEIIAKSLTDTVDATSSVDTATVEAKPTAIKSTGKNSISKANDDKTKATKAPARKPAAKKSVAFKSSAATSPVEKLSNEKSSDDKSLNDKSTVVPPLPETKAPVEKSPPTNTMPAKPTKKAAIKSNSTENKPPAKKAKITVRNIETMTTPKISEKESPNVPDEEQSDDDDDDDMSLTKLKATMAKTKQQQQEQQQHREQPSASPSKASETIDTVNKNPPVESKNSVELIGENAPAKKNPVRKLLKQTSTSIKDDGKSDAAKDEKPSSKNAPKSTDIYDFHESGNTSEHSEHSDNDDQLKKNSKKKGVDLITKKVSIGVQKKKPMKTKIVKTKEKTETLKSILKDTSSMVSAGKANNNKTDKSVAKPKVEKKSVKLKKEDDKCKQKASAARNYSDIGNDTDTPHETSSESSYSNEEGAQNQKRYLKKKTKTKSMGKGKASDSDDDSDDDSDSDGSNNRQTNMRKIAAKNRRMKLYGFYSGPKRHRMASLNALAKVQCLYENESRTAQELGFVKEPRIQPKEHTTSLQTIAKPEKSDIDRGDAHDAKDEKSSKKVEKKTATVTNKNNKVKNEPEDNSRTLRNAPGIRGAGNLWEMDGSSMDDDSDGSDSDASRKQNIQDKAKEKKPPASAKRPAATKTKSGTDTDSNERNNKKAVVKKSPAAPKAKPIKPAKSAATTSVSKTEVKDVVVRKRMASLNASAMLAAAYEVERHIDRAEAKYNAASSATDSDASPPTPKRLKDIKNEARDEKDAKPVSTNVVIVQDTDVTITGVYVNASLGSSQEAYCKMQYRVQSSVTEERLLQTNTQDPPKSYTPLSALSGMLPPGSDAADPMIPQASGIASSSIPPHIPTQSPSDCDSSFMYQSMYRQQPHPQLPSAPMHPIPSAFCPFPPQPQHDPMGYYQPAGPLISSHFVGPQNLTKPPSSLLEPDPRGPQQSTSSTEPPETEILIAGDRYPPPPPPQQTSALQLSIPYPRNLHQMHCPTYPYPYGPYFGQHPQDLCYPEYRQQFPPQQQPQIHDESLRVNITRRLHRDTPDPSYPYPYRRYLPSAPPPHAHPYYQPPTTFVDSSGNLPPPPSPAIFDSSARPPPISSSGPQHIDHYSPYCYSPGGGQCYSRGPPYMESSPYPQNCPCPMQQSCPKNVHTGPLIGSKTGKGPGQQTNNIHQVASHNDQNTLITTTTPSSIVHQSVASLKLPSASSADATSCKLTDTTNINNNNSAHSIFVKPEIDDVDHHHHHRLETMPANSIVVSTSGTACANIYLTDQTDRDKLLGFAGAVAHYYPNYSLNPKVLEPPEQSVSPARGSTGLSESPSSLQTSASEQHNHPIAPATATATPIATDAANTNLAINSHSYSSVIGRRARVGKSMAREMMMQPHLTMPLKHDKDADENNGQMAIDMNKTGIINNINSSALTIGHTFLSNHENIPTALIKQENVKKEKEDIELHSSEKVLDLASIVAEHLPSSAECDIMENGNKRKLIDEPINEIKNLEESSLEVVAPILKRQKMLEIRQNSTKLSAKCSYKSLIKPSRPKPYLCKSGRKKLFTKGPYRLMNHRQHSANNAINIMKKPKNKKIRKKMLLLDRRPPSTSSSEPTSSTEDSNLLVSSTRTFIPCEINELSVPSLAESELEKNAKEPIGLSSNSKANFSTDTEMFTQIDVTATGASADKKLAKKNGKSVSRRNASPDEVSAKKSNKNTKKSASSNESNSNEKSHAQPKLMKHFKSTDILNIDDSDHEPEMNAKVSSPPSPQSISTHSSLEPKIKTKTSSKTKINKNSNVKLHNETIGMNNNNNSLLFDKNNCINNDRTGIDGDADVLLDSTPNTTQKAMPAIVKRCKSRGTKFSNKKRHRIRSVQEVPPTILPRRTATVPRWSNGWSWEGEPFQGKVFLNSDEHQVFRTRYSAMKHDTGDIIQPGDCVLLRAGSKKNELPYVAKVASLWENPEDGEMMMSLFWYYRPEHTEQGRQTTDCLDEVFASKHLDHNSVACIEDKCYVLTFNEYCRYRKTIKSIEEGVEMVPSIVPQLNEQIDPEIPLNTNSELILFCRRVYDFRLKRLIKNPT